MKWKAHLISTDRLHCCVILSLVACWVSSADPIDYPPPPPCNIDRYQSLFVSWIIKTADKIALLLLRSQTEGEGQITTHKAVKCQKSIWRPKRMALSVHRPSLARPSDPSKHSVKEFSTERLKTWDMLHTPQTFELSGDSNRLLGGSREACKNSIRYSYNRLYAIRSPVVIFLWNCLNISNSI